MNFLFLYTELAGYTIACLTNLANRGHQIHLVHWPVNPEAPFQFNIPDAINCYPRNTISENEIENLIKQTNPSAIICSGWIDKGYIKAIKKSKFKGNRILILDNQYRGDFKQQIAIFSAPFWLNKIFNKAWVPGVLQAKFAEKLGYKNHNLKRGFYAADTPYFSAIYKKTFPAKTADFPKRFLYVGRYVDFKGIEEMWQAFSAINPDKLNGWELWCVGTGAMYPQRPNIKGVKHLGFKQPHELPEIIAQTGVFIMPSRVEPWGVVLHEMTTCGMPVITTPKVGAATEFLQPNINGFLVPEANTQALKDAMIKFIEMPTERLIEMGQQSHKIGLKITPDTWSNTLEELAS
jgi:glycosyltransferase involved in cell wall biosynthesis